MYCRVSSTGQKDDLQSQVKAMENFCLSQGVIVTDFVQEIGGGLNFKRPKFLLIVRSCIQGEVKMLYVAHKDSFPSFTTEIIAPGT